MRAVLVVILACLAGCRIGGGSIEAENDRLRRERHDLIERIADLQAERDELRAKVHELGLRQDPTLPDEALDALPRVAAIEIDSLSGLVPARPDADAHSVRLYIRTLDGRRRFTQAVGTLRVSCELLPPPGHDSPPRTANRTLTPAQVREAYRSGLVGTHYTVELPLAIPAEERRGTLVLRAELHDALTGTLHRAHLSRDLPRP
jgi:hypothetical protein